jgi:hypothetical protein
MKKEILKQLKSDYGFKVELQRELGLDDLENEILELKEKLKQNK